MRRARRLLVVLVLVAGAVGLLWGNPPEISSAARSEPSTALEATRSPRT